MGEVTEYSAIASLAFVALIWVLAIGASVAEYFRGQARDRTE